MAFSANYPRRYIFAEEKAMKKLTISILIALVLTFVISSVSNAADVCGLTDKLIRLHVIANSDSESDQNIKLAVRDEVLCKVSELCSDVGSKDEAEKIILSHIDEIESAANDALKETGYKAECRYETVDIDKRVYDDFTLPAGVYDALCVRIGKAEGENWWCVVYPSLCVSCAVSIDDCGVFSEDELTIVKQPEKVKYKLYCFELFRKLKSYLNDLPKLRTNK